VEKVSLDGRDPGRAIVMESPDFEVFARVFIAGGRFYQLMASGKIGTVNRSDVEAFFDTNPARRLSAGAVRGLLGGNDLTPFFFAVGHTCSANTDYFFLASNSATSFLKSSRERSPSQSLRFFNCLTSRRPLPTACRKSVMALSGWFN
jgi:hypothetical protein